ncbi:hypothetical protein HWV62_1324 [Athelia sp. TMB]|nr:hypothetical protein HWV62_1324 [Athelia sp. TMB]
MFTAKPFWVPLTFPTPAVIPGSTTDGLDLVEQACSDSEVSAITSWGLSGVDVVEARGVALGCADGTVYLFHTSQTPSVTETLQQSSRSPSSVSIIDVSRPVTPAPHSRRPSRSHHAGSRSASPSALAFQHNTFSLTPRAQAVSGLSKQQVEAPKNYVDFDEEQGKLKGMLKGKGIRDKTIVDHLLPSFDKGVVVDKKEKSTPPPLSMPQKTSSLAKRKEDARSLLSANTSPSFTPKSLSAPSSPMLVAQGAPGAHLAGSTLALRCHVYPRRPGAVRALTLVNDNRLLISMQENGDISVFKSQDGKCIVSCETASWKLQPANGSQESSEEGLVWQRLSVLPNGEGLYEASLEPLGHWPVDGSMESIVLHREMDDSISFIYVNRLGNFMAQTIRILPRPLPLTALQAVPRTESPGPGSRLPLPDINMHVPNPFKRQKSNDGIPQITSDAAASGAGRVVLGDLVDGGVPLLGGGEVPIRMRVWLEGGKLTGSIWGTEFIIFTWENKTLRTKSATLLHEPTLRMHDLVWIDESSYVAIFEDRCEIYEVRNVDENNDSAPTARWRGIIIKEFTA